MSNKVHIVPHMHWDREWYFSAEESELLLINNMKEIMERLESDEDYPVYVLDGQTVVLEDYLSLMPENKDRITKLIRDGRLIIGPWYTQPDEMVVGSESIVRNLLYGHKDCKEYDKIMKIGYLPDSFGQSGRMPSILNGFGIDKAMFWRGTSERMGSNKTEFYWTSDDGGKVLTQLLPLGYAIGKYLPTDIDELKKRCDKYMPVLERGATGPNILLPNGHDQMPIQENIQEVMKQLKVLYPNKDFFLSSYENLFKELEKKNDYDTLSGELLDGKYMRVHRSIYSSRADIKTMNTIVENKITNVLEPLASIAYSLGFEYYHGALESIWKLIMKNHAHDSIGCCCSDKVHAQIYNRFVVANEKVDCLIEFYKRKITDSMSCEVTLDKLTVFNLLPYERKNVVRGEVITRMKSFALYDSNNCKVNYDIVSKEEIDAGLIDRQIVHYGNYDPFYKYIVEFDGDIPAMGFTTYFVKEENENNDVNVIVGNQLENEYYNIEINKNGSVNILDKQSNKIYSDVLILENSGDDGDSYDYSPMLNDYVVTSNDVEAKYEINKSSYSSTATISYQFAIPKDANSRSNKLIDSHIDVEIKIELLKGDKNIRINFVVDNTAVDHRLRVLIPSAIVGQNSICDNQFGIVTRPVIDPSMSVWQEEKWSERPDSIYPFLSYVAVENSSIAAISNSIREYEIIGKEFNTIALTLYRSIGYLGKENLIRRPERPSGIKMPIPDSQLLKTLEFEIGITTFEDKSELSHKSKEFLTPLVTYNKMPYNAMKLNDSKIIIPYNFSLFKESNHQITLSTLKKAEYSNELIYRVFNTSNFVQESDLENISIVDVVNLNEERINDNYKLNNNQFKSFVLSK